MIGDFFKLTKKPFELDEYKYLLDRMFQFDGISAARVTHWLALRSAMRVMPILAAKGDLSFWDEQERVKFLSVLLVPYRVRHSGFNMDAIASAYVMKGEGEAIVRAQYITGAVRAACYAMMGGVDNISSYARQAIDWAYRACEDSIVHEALKKDIEQLNHGVTDFADSPLWWGKVPPFFSENLNKLEVIVAQLPRAGGDQEAFNIINSALDRLWGVPRVNIINRAAIKVFT
jgi:hypothetical protein